MSHCATDGRPPFAAAPLNQAGLNRQAIFNLDELPAALVASLDCGGNYRQLILLGHGGKALWNGVKAAGIDSENPIDDYSIRCIEDYFAQYLPDNHYQIIYPGQQPIGLQQLGQLAGWHHASPFMVGIDGEWGSWFAYRAVVLADTHFLPSTAVDREHPCSRCKDKPCLSHCLGQALATGSLILEKCITYRKQALSPCRESCLARLACPVGKEHRYETEQMQHCYSISLRVIENIPLV